MKVHLLYQTTTLPSGGGNQFFRALNNVFSLNNAQADSLEEADVVLFNSHHFLDKVVDAKKRFPEKVFVQRIDGPMRLYNQKSDSRDHAVNIGAELISDGTIFQSQWSGDANYGLALFQNKYAIVIPNSADPNIFNRNVENTFSKDRVIRLVATSWSANWKKGFKVYKWLDEHLDFNRYEMVFIGNSPTKFNNIRHIPPLKSEELARELQHNDIYITASQKDPCSNSLIEALHCGLPAVVLQDGGHIEILGRAGETFKRAEEIPDLLEKITVRYADYQARISLPPIEKVADQYLDFMHKIHERTRKGLYKPKRLSWAGLIRIQTQLTAWRLRAKLTAVKDMICARIGKRVIAVPFLTFRRYYLDRILANTSFYGKILDVGGKKENKRGRFRPPRQNVESWEYLNIDISTKPDYCCSADNIPVPDDSFHMVLMTEVLEHLENPQRALKECQRVLRKDGQLIISIPFLYMIHSDPHDYLRWTPEGIRKELINAGFAVKQILPMGGLFAVIYDLLRNSLHMTLQNRVTFIKRLINKLLMPGLSRLCFYFDRKTESMNTGVATGYYVVGIKGLEGLADT